MNEADALRSVDRVNQIRDGLNLPDRFDRIYWIDKARRRITCLEDCEPIFGLMPHEQAEMTILRQLVAKEMAQ
jgi:hypothetical protein